MRVRRPIDELDGVDLRPGAGVPPGEAWASDLLALVYNLVLDDFLAAIVDKAQPAELSCRLAQDGEADRVLDIGLTAYADDIPRIVALTRVSYLAVEEAVCDKDVSLNAELHPAGMFQNHSKKGILPVLQGAGSRMARRQLFRHSFCRGRVRYLWFLVPLHPLWRQHSGRNVRLQEAHIGYSTLRGFWHVASPRLVRIAFRAVFFAPLVSGWVVVCPTSLHVMQARQVAYARSMLSSEACVKTPQSSLASGLPRSTWSFASCCCASGDRCCLRPAGAPCSSRRSSGSASGLTR